MKSRHILSVLAIAAASIVLSTSCINRDKSMGDDYIPQEQILKVRVDTIDFPIQSKMMDSLQAISSLYMALGSFSSEEFGQSVFNSAIELEPSSTGLSFGKDWIVKGVHIEIPLAEIDESSTTIESNKLVHYELAKSIVQNIDVYRMLVNIDSLVCFNNSLKPEHIGTEKLNINGQVAFFGNDTLRIELDPKLGEEYLSATELELDSLNHFVKGHKGLYFKCTPSPGTDNGGRLCIFDQANAFLSLKFSFIPTWEEGLSRRDTAVIFYVRNSYALNSSEFGSRSLENPDEHVSSIPVQGAGGISPFIDRNKLKAAIDNWIESKHIDPKSLSIVRARASLPFNRPSDEILKYQYAPSLFPVQRYVTSEGSSIKYYYMIDDYSSLGNTMGAMLLEKEKYIFDFSTMVQDFVRRSKAEIDEDETVDMWLSPYWTIVDETYGTTTTTLDAFSQFKFNINGLGAERKPIIELIYTVNPQ